MRKRIVVYGAAALLMVALLACRMAVAPTPTPTAERAEAVCNKDNQTLRWDFSETRSTDQIDYPEECWIGNRSIFFIDANIELLLPDGIRVGPLDSPQVAVERDGLALNKGVERLGDILVEMTTEPLTVDETYAYALELAEAYGLSRRNFDQWYQEALEDPRNPTRLGGFAQRQLVEGGPTLLVDISLSFDEERPYVVYLSALWPFDLATPTP
ncbi:MAG: hypothetical protein KDD73_08830 [Anaerolineales bacterium]|nr:hypothetical protein [Anaerolineales bacterium]MCB9128054.1 hypothetical protein [Ardenticatenales bacterium]